jgi:predicted protein tyrosine phosphatase
MRSMEELSPEHASVVTRPDPRLLILEIGGTNKASKPSALPSSAVVINAARLPNPHTPINRKTLDLSAASIVDWMENKDAQANGHMEAMVSRAKAAFSAQRSVRVECYGGAHRSQAVAWKILSAMDKLSLDQVNVVCVDCDPLPELAQFVCASS